jgi:hypothetical protein
MLGSVKSVELLPDAWVDTKNELPVDTVNQKSWRSDDTNSCMGTVDLLVTLAYWILPVANEPAEVGVSDIVKIVVMAPLGQVIILLSILLIPEIVWVV